MKKLYILILSLIWTGNTFAQDLIVTEKGDSIHCSINSVKKDHIYFSFKHKKSNEIRNTLLPLIDITQYQYNFYKTKEVPESYKKNTQRKGKSFQILINGGYSYRTAKIDKRADELEKDYIKGLKSGYHFGADFTYYFAETYGIGLKFNQSKASNRLNNLIFTDDSENSINGVLEDNISILFIGPFYTTRYFIGKNNNALYANLALGYIGYSNNATYIDQKFELTGRTFGSALDFGFDLTIAKNLGLDLRLSMVGGVLKGYERKNSNGSSVTISLEKENYESLHRIDVSLGLRYTL